MKKIFLVFLLFSVLLILPSQLFAAGISVSGGGTKTVGQTFTVSIVASGGSFDSFQGTINVSGPIEVVSVTPGSATWLPGREPKVGSQFVGITKETSSLTIATIKLKATKEGTAKVEVGGVKLAKAGNLVGEGGGSATFTIQKAPELPGAVAVSSSTHPDQNQAYEATTVVLNWTKMTGVTGFSYLLDQNPNTTPPAKVTSSETSVTYSDLKPGIYYFHIRAQNKDGFGTTTHFKITIKEPEPKESSSLKAPSEIQITKAPDFENDIENGLVKGIVISGKGEAGFEIIAELTPRPSAYQGRKISGMAGEDGYFQIKIDEKIPSGFYKLVLFGQKDLTLTPKSPEIRFEISQKGGGTISLLSRSDTSPLPTPALSPNSLPQKNSGFEEKMALFPLSFSLLTVLSVLTRIIRSTKL